MSFSVLMTCVLKGHTCLWVNESADFDQSSCWKLEFNCSDFLKVYCQISTLVPRLLCTGSDGYVTTIKLVFSLDDHYLSESLTLSVSFALCVWFGLSVLRFWDWMKSLFLSSFVLCSQDLSALAKELRELRVEEGSRPPVKVKWQL